MFIKRYGHTRHWAVYDDEDRLICLCVYKKGALEVVRRLERAAKALDAVHSGGCTMR
jgi:hypothetical protein